MHVESVKIRQAVQPGSFKRVFSLPIPVYLAWKDIWRNRGRYFLISLVVALITTLVLFIAGLAEGLGTGNREYIEKLNADLLLYQANVDFSIPSSRLGWSVRRDIRRIENVKDVGLIGFSNTSILRGDNQQPLKVSMIGVVPGKPGEPPVEVGQNLRSSRTKDAIIDANVAEQAGLDVGDRITIKSILGTEEKFYDLEVLGISNSRQYSIQPSIFVPYKTWDEIKPQAEESDGQSEIVFNIAAVQLDNTRSFEIMRTRLESAVSNVEAADRKTAYENTPGYSAQQSTLNTQRIFTLIIGVLVLGGFFQIQTLQKVAQVGMLKAIGASSAAIIITSILQIVTINVLGVLIGGLGTFLLAQVLPAGIPLVIEGSAVTSAIFSLLLIGPLGGIVSIGTILRAEPLTALGLAQ